MATNPPRSRSFKQMRDDVKRLQEENARLKQAMDEKEQPTPEQIKIKNPNRANPNPNQPIIKLMDYSTDWLEQERSNVVVELNKDFEDLSIEAHSRIVENDNLSTLGLSDRQKQEVKSCYTSFSVLNLCYRLLLTLPSGYNLEAKVLIDAMKADEVPQNSAVLNEMFSHIGKTKTDHYGNLRLAYPLQLAKKKICKAMCILKDFQYFRDEFQLKDDNSLEDLSAAYENGIFKDKDAADFLSYQGMKFLDEFSLTGYKFKFDGHDVFWKIPDRFETKFFSKGRYRPPVHFVSEWCVSSKILRLQKDDNVTNTYYKLCCAMIAQIIDKNYIGSNLTLSEWNPAFKANDFKDMKWEDFATYLGIVDLDSILSTDMLANNYFIIMERYRDFAEKHVRSVFKLSNIKKDEFGTDAQMLICPEWKKDGNNAVDSSFKINDKNKAVAAGLFNFSRKVDINVSDRMYLKNSVRSMLSNLISKFVRK